MVENLTLDTFKEKVHDFEADKDWKYKGTTPAIIDFYADWCGPCKMIAPILEELDQEYNGKIQIYKVNTEKEMELAGMFGIRSIPSLLFIPLEEQPQMMTGALPKPGLEQAIKDIFNVEK